MEGHLNSFALESLSQYIKQHALESEGDSKPVCCFLYVTESGKVTRRIRMSPVPLWYETQVIFYTLL